MLLLRLRDETRMNLDTYAEIYRCLVCGCLAQRKPGRMNSCLGCCGMTIRTSQPNVCPVGGMSKIMVFLTFDRIPIGELHSTRARCQTRLSSFPPKSITSRATLGRDDIVGRDSFAFSRRKVEGAQQELDGARLLLVELQHQTADLQTQVRSLEADLASMTRCAL